jgi:ribonuclease Z
MSISYSVLGKPGKDNALFVKVNSGKRFTRLLFDAGESVLNTVDQGDIKSIDYIFFSHCHIDHIAGFDYLFRRIFDREKPINVFGPHGITSVILHRLNGYTWNLISGTPGEWIIHELQGDKTLISVIRAADSFSKVSSTEVRHGGNIVLSNNDFEVKVFFLNHSIPSAGYVLKEKETYNVDKNRLAQLGITPGEWLQKVKDDNSDMDEVIYTGGRSYSVLYLKELLLRKKEGDSVVYMTDFLFDQAVEDSLKLISNCNTIVCESQYLDEDKQLAEQNFHITSRQAAMIAARSKAEKLILFHISDRYRGDDFLTLLEEARELFPKTYYPSEWNI